MKRYIEEYGLIMTVVAAVLLLLLFYKTGIASNVKNMFVEEVKTIMTADPANDKQVVMVRYENPDGTFGDYETVESKYVKDGETFSWNFPESDTFQAASVNYTVNGAKTNKVSIYRQQYFVDFNGWVEGIDGGMKGTTVGLGTFDVYVSGKKVCSNTTDCYPNLRVGEAYEVKNIKAAAGYKYTGIATAKEMQITQESYPKTPFEAAVGTMDTKYTHYNGYKGRSVFLKFASNN